MKQYFLRGLFLTAAVALAAQNKPSPSGVQADVAAAAASADVPVDRTYTYKVVGGVTLKLSVFEPPGAVSRPVAAVVFFHGGAFVTGSPEQFYHQCRYLADRGMVGISVQYRLKTTDGTDVDAAIADAKSAMRWVRAHAAELGIDPERIAAGGGSAGGFLAYAVATLDAFDEKGEDTSVSCRPDALVIYCGVFDAGPGSRRFEQTKRKYGDKWPEISPFHNVRAPFPPTISFIGDRDSFVTLAQAMEMAAKIEATGARCDLHTYPGQVHGFFNYGRNGNHFYEVTLAETDKFLTSIGYLSAHPSN